MKNLRNVVFKEIIRYSKLLNKKKKNMDGYQSWISITQSRTNILQIIRYHFGGSITSSSNRNNKVTDVMDDTNEYYHKHNIRNEYNLLIRNNEYQILLYYLQNSFLSLKKINIIVYMNLINWQIY